MEKAVYFSYTLAAAMGLVNLDNLDNVLGVNKRNHRLYAEKISGLSGIKLLEFDEAEQNNYQYVVIEVSEECAATRDMIIQVLQAENILARKYFWPGCHKMKPYIDLFPHSNLFLSSTLRVAERVIVLPTGTGIGETEISTITNIIQYLLRGCLT